MHEGETSLTLIRIFHLSFALSRIQYEFYYNFHECLMAQNFHKWHEVPL